MTKYGRLIVNTRPGNVEIYIDGQKSSTMILNDKMEGRIHVIQKPLNDYSPLQ